MRLLIGEMLAKPAIINARNKRGNTKCMVERSTWRDVACMCTLIRPKHCRTGKSKRWGLDHRFGS
jgi:hypothetical protein